MMPGLRTFISNTFTPAEAVGLAGTTAAPRAAAHTTTTPTNASADWEFRTDGSVYKDEGGVFTQDNAATTWYPAGSPPTGTYWIRFTLFSGSSPTGGDALNTWHALAGVLRSFEYHQSIPGSVSGTVKVEIATDSAGSTIVATGYYSGFADENT